MKNIYLVGFMGSGKSTVGRLLAEKLNMRFVDIDKEVEKSKGMSIREIFQKFGEDYFRNLEKEKLREFLRRSGFIVSTGGGLGADIDIMNLMREDGKVIWIRADIQTILDRCKDDTKRPLLKLPKDKLLELFKKREKVYSLAHITVDSDKKTPIQVFQEIVEKI